MVHGQPFRIKLNIDLAFTVAFNNDRTHPGNLLQVVGYNVFCQTGKLWIALFCIQCQNEHRCHGGIEFEHHGFLNILW